MRTYSIHYFCRFVPVTKDAVWVDECTQELMEIVLSGLARSICVVLDDVLVFGRTMTEHNANLSQRLLEAGLKLRPGKCQFALTEVGYLEHVVS